MHVEDETDAKLLYRENPTCEYTLTLPGGGVSAVGVGERSRLCGWCWGRGTTANKRRGEKRSAKACTTISPPRSYGGTIFRRATHIGYLQYVVNGVLIF